MALFNKKNINDKYWLIQYNQIKDLATNGEIDIAAEKSIELYNYSLENGGKEDDRTLNASNNLGYLFTEQKEYEKAEFYLLTALQISEKKFGKYSKEVAILCMNIGKMFMERTKHIAKQLEPKQAVNIL